MVRDGSYVVDKPGGFVECLSWIHLLIFTKLPLSQCSVQRFLLVSSQNLMAMLRFLPIQVLSGFYLFPRIACRFLRIQSSLLFQLFREVLPNQVFLPLVSLLSTRYATTSIVQYLTDF